MSRAATVLMLMTLSGCGWLSAGDVQAQYCADFSRNQPSAETLALLQTCTASSDCLCPNSICVNMVVADGGLEARCNPPDNNAPMCPLFFNSDKVAWKQGDDCLPSCLAVSGKEKQCVWFGSNSRCNKILAKCE